MSSNLLTLAEIEAARERIRPYVRRTPVLASDVLDAAAAGKLFFKCECLQHLGAFKVRGATNAVFQIPEREAARGVVTHSSGNHGAAVAGAAAQRGIPAYVVMPEGTLKPKAAQVARLGGQITFCAPTQAAREAAAARIVAETGATFIHPFDNRQVMAGQGTVGLELLEDVPDLDLVLAPIGGGGLISGLSTAVKALRPDARMIGAEPAGADDAARSLHAHKLIPLTEARTIADGLRTSLSADTFAHVEARVDDIVTVSEDAIVAAMRALWEALRVTVEPSAAVPYAAISEGKLDVRGKSVGIVLTGGNADLDRLPWLAAAS